MKRGFFCAVTVFALLLCLFQPVSAIHASFYDTHSDWHFDLSLEPDRAITTATAATQTAPLPEK